MISQQPATSEKQDKYKYFDKLNYLSLQSLESVYEDQVTCNTYKKAILNHPLLFRNKIVLNLTQGINCLYAIFAAQTGAQKVYCVVNGHCENEKKNIFMMKEIIENNKLSSIIQVLSFKDFNAEVDVIIAEPVSYCLYFDSLIDRMIEARDLYLRKNGIMIPDRVNFKCCLIRDLHYIDKKINYWNNVYDVKMTCIQNWIAQQPIIRVVDPSLIVSDVIKFLSFDLQTCKYQQIEMFLKEINIAPNLLPKQDQQIVSCNGLSMWFQLQFNHCDQKIDIKASPWSYRTRWTQVTLYSSKNWVFQNGKLGKIHFYGMKNFKQNRGIIKLKVNNVEEVYTYS